MPFLFFSNLNWEFRAKKPIRESYTAAETLVIVEIVKLIYQLEFALTYFFLTVFWSKAIRFP